MSDMEKIESNPELGFTRDEAPICENGPHTGCACCAWKVTQSDLFTSRLQNLREIVAIQCNDGNWNYNAYMHGLANGLLMAVATMADEECKFMDAPDRWLADGPPVASTIEDKAVCTAPLADVSAHIAQARAVTP